MKAYEMTLNQYRELVAPIIAAYFKFLKKNSKFFKKVDYYGLPYEIWSEYYNNKKENYDPKQHYNLPFNEERTREYWTEKTGGAPMDPPSNIVAERDAFMKQLAEYLTPNDIKKFEDDEKKSNKRIVKRAADDGTYVQMLIDGFLTPQKVQEIFDSVGVRVPRHVQEMKDKVQYQGYSRSVHDRLLSSGKEFEIKLRKALLPYMHILEDRYRGQIENLMKDYLKFVDENPQERFAIGRYCERKSTSRTDYVNKMDTLQRYTEKGQKSSKYEEILNKDAKEYAEQFIVEFLFRVQDKLKVITSKKGIPTFEISNMDFKLGRAVGNFFVHYPDGTTLRLEVEIIFAGGYNIQSLHDRYLFKVFKDGKMVKLEDLDKAFENVSESVKLKRYDTL